jgi:hypothetical protein
MNIPPKTTLRFRFVKTFEEAALPAIADQTGAADRLLGQQESGGCGAKEGHM